MSKYVSPLGYAGTDHSQSVMWHYRTDIDRNCLDRWFVNIFDQGVVYYVPNPDTVSNPSTAGGSILTISLGTSLLIKQKITGVDGEKIAKLDMVRDWEIDVSGYSPGTYHVLAVWENAAEEFRGVDFYIYTDAEKTTNLDTPGYNYVKLGEVTIASGGTIDANNTDNQTVGSMFSGLAGWSGYSGESGFSGASGRSGYSGHYGEDGISGISGYSGASGYTGFSGFSGAPDTGPSGYSGVSGYSGPSGYSGYSGRSGTSGVSGWSGTASLSFVYSGADTIDENNMIVIPVYRSADQINLVSLKLWGQKFPTYHYTELPEHDHATTQFASAAHTHTSVTHNHTISYTGSTGSGSSHKHSFASTSNTTVESANHIHKVPNVDADPDQNAWTEAQSATHIHTVTASGNTGTEASHTHSIGVSDATTKSASTIQANTSTTAIPTDGIAPTGLTVNTIEKDYLTTTLGTSHVGLYVDTDSSVNPVDLGTRYTITTGGKWADLVNLNTTAGTTIDITTEAPASGYFFIKINNTQASHGSKILWHVAVN